MEETSIHENYTEAYRLFDLIAWISSCNDHGKVCRYILIFSKFRKYFVISLWNTTMRTMNYLGLNYGCIEAKIVMYPSSFHYALSARGGRTVHFGKIWVNRRTSSCIILHHHLHPPPWPHSCPLPHLPLCFCLCHCHWEKQSLQLAVVIVLLLIRIRLISLLELGASGPSPLSPPWWTPPSLLFITICSL